MNKLYRDTVTLYHADAAAQTVVRTVLRGVCWQQGRRELPDAGGTRRGTALLVVIEHNLDVIKWADHVIDLGPEGGSGGGHIVCTGTPEEVAQCAASYTGQYLKRMLEK